MASLHHTLTSLQCTHSLPKTFLSSKPLSNLSFSASSSTSSRHLHLSAAASHRPHGGALGAKMTSSAAASYAAALADVAKSNNTLDSTTTDIEKIEELFSDPNVSSFFTNPTIEISKKKKVIKLISEKLQFQPHTANFLNVLVEFERIEMVNEIVKEYEAVCNELTETEVAIVRSVVTLEWRQLSEIAKAVQKLTRARNVRIKTVIDESLVAGFTIRFGNCGSKFIDMSVRKQLDEIAAQFDLE